jgi:hypothetical protein
MRIVECGIELRMEIARRARDKNRRRFDFCREEPVVWKPTEVVNPECGLCFTDIGAWHFIADQVERGCDIYEVELRKPPQTTGYELHLPGAPGNPPIYIKFRLVQREIRGRSFHNSTRSLPTI